MFAGRDQTKFGAWRLKGHPQVVEYAQPVLDSVLSHVTVGFRTGFAVGGVLFGEGDRHLVRILAVRPISCDYGAGPSFTLSEDDHKRLATLLSRSADDPELKEMVPVGWYHSHTRSGLTLTPSDLALDRRHLGSGIHIAILLRPDESRPTSAGVFVEGDGGEMSSEPVLVIEELAGSKPIERALRKAPPPLEVPPAAPVPAAEAPPPEPPMFASLAGKSGSAGIRIPSNWKSVVAGVVLLVAGFWAAGRWLAPPEYWGAIDEYRASAGRYLDTVSDYWRQVGLPASMSRLSLRALASGSELVVRWDSTSSLLAGVTSGVLDIQDGARGLREELDMAMLVNGSYSHRRISDDVRIRLTLYREDAEPYSESTRFLDGGYIGEAPVTEAEAVLPETLQAEIESLRIAILRQREQSRTFENTLEAMRRISGSRRAAPPRPAESPPAVAIAQRPPSPPQNSASPPPASTPVLQQSPAAIVQQRPAAILQQSPPSQPASSMAATSPLSGPASGRLIWTGFLPEGQVLTIQDGAAANGNLSGRLPGVPVRVTVYPGELTEAGLAVFSDQRQHAGTVTEPPAAQNSWTRTTYRYDPPRAQSVAVVELPAAQNNWGRIVVRSTGQPLSVVVIDWRRSN